MRRTSKRRQHLDLAREQWSRERWAETQRQMLGLPKQRDFNELWRESPRQRQAGTATLAPAPAGAAGRPGRIERATSKRKGLIDHGKE